MSSGIVEPALEHQRLDKWLKGRYPALSNAQIDEAIQKGLLGRAKKGDKGENWDTTALDRHLLTLRTGHPLAVPVVAERVGFVVVDKPAGVPGHPVSLFEDKTLTHWAFFQYPATLEEFPEPQPILTPHRLDTGTSGLQIVALNKGAFDAWRESFKQKRVKKTYLAWCWGRPKKEKFEVNYGLAHLSQDDSRMGVPALGDKTKGETHSAQSICSVLERKEDRFSVKVECFTGVTHQIRVHLAAAGFPLVGDRQYDPKHVDRKHSPSHHELKAVRLEAPGFDFRLE